MTDTNQLPEPELGYIKTDKSNQPAFSARQMREAMLVCGAQNAESDSQVPLSLTAAPQQATPDDMKVYDSIADRYFREATQADVTDEDVIFSDWLKAACLTYYPGADIIEPDKFTHLCKDDIIQLIRVASSRAILALRP